MIGPWLALGGALVTTALAQVAYKLHYGRPGGGWLAAAIAMFVAASVLAYLALRALPVGTVYMSTALTQLLVAALAWRVLREPFTREHGIAMAFIVLGIVVYAA